MIFFVAHLTHMFYLTLRVCTHTHIHMPVHFVIKLKSKKRVPEQRGGDRKDQEVGDSNPKGVPVSIISSSVVWSWNI